MRLLIAITNQGRRAAVYFNRELEEYTVRFYSHGEHLTSADYFTDCKSDAYNTMNHYAAGIDRHMAAFGGFPNSRHNKGAWIKGTDEDDEDYEYIPSASELS